MSNRADIAAQIATDIRLVMQPLVGKPNNKAARDRARRAVEKVLRKYREAGLPIDNVIALRDVKTGKFHIRVVQRQVVDDDCVPSPIEFSGWAEPVVKLRPCKCCDGSGEILTGEFDEDGDLRPPELCGRCSGSGHEPFFRGCSA
jgi:DnaJ-class molecular chaperone